MDTYLTPWLTNAFASSDATGSTPRTTSNRGLFERQVMICLPHHPSPGNSDAHRHVQSFLY